MLDLSSLASRAPIGLGVVHRRRLREVYRSAGWPCQDGIEIELLAAGLLARERGPLGHETIRLTDAGIAVLAETLAKNRARRDPHEQLVERMVKELKRRTSKTIELRSLNPSHKERTLPVRDVVWIARIVWASQ